MGCFWLELESTSYMIEHPKVGLLSVNIKRFLSMTFLKFIGVFEPREKYIAVAVWIVPVVQVSKLCRIR